jgi:urease accessory protein
MDSLTVSLTGKAPAQRAAGTARLACRRLGERTRLDRLYQEGSAKIRIPAGGRGPLEAILINTSGGMTGGDRLDWRIEAGAGADVIVTSQACEKIYRAESARADVSVRLSVGQAGRIAWLPQETIVFDRADFSRRLEADIAPGAELLVLEATLFGRLAMGETVVNGLFRDSWRIRQGGAPIHAEEMRIGPSITETLARPATANGAAAVATALLVSPRAETLLDGARAILGDHGGASFWTVGETGKLLARLHAEDGYRLRQRLAPLVRLLNGEAGLPKSWSL